MDEKFKMHMVFYPFYLRFLGTKDKHLKNMPIFYHKLRCVARDFFEKTIFFGRKCFPERLLRCFFKKNTSTRSCIFDKLTGGNTNEVFKCFAEMVNVGKL